MTEDAPKFTPTDLERIQFDNREGLRYWLAELGCTRDALFSAIQEVGDYSKDVRSYLVLKADKLPQP